MSRVAYMPGHRPERLWHPPLKSQRTALPSGVGRLKRKVLRLAQSFGKPSLAFRAHHQFADSTKRLFAEEAMSYISL
jgi:hypothetical protein